MSEESTKIGHLGQTLHSFQANIKIAGKLDIQANADHILKYYYF